MSEQTSNEATDPSCWPIKQAASPADDRPAPDWPAIVAAHAPLVWQTICRVLTGAEDRHDVFQETFAAAIEGAANEQTEGREVRSWPAFLRVIATRRAIDRLRVRRPVPLESDPTGPCPLPESVDAADTLRSLLAGLPPQEAEVFVLIGIEGLTYAEAAEATGCSVNHVGVTLHRARDRLRRAFAALEPDAVPAPMS